MDNVIADSFLKTGFGNISTFDEFKACTLYVKNHNIVIEFYSGEYDFTNAELIILLEDLNYLRSELDKLAKDQTSRQALSTNGNRIFGSGHRILPLLRLVDLRLLDRFGIFSPCDL